MSVCMNMINAQRKEATLIISNSFFFALKLSQIGCIVSHCKDFEIYQVNLYCMKNI